MHLPDALIKLHQDESSNTDNSVTLVTVYKLTFLAYKGNIDITNINWQALKME